MDHHRRAYTCPTLLPLISYAQAHPLTRLQYAGPKIAEKFYESNWRWGYGAFAIILPFVCLPMFFFLQHHKRRAQKMGVVIKTPSGRTFTQAVVYYLIEFDCK